MSSAVRARLGWCVVVVMLGTVLAAALPAWAQAGVKPKPAGVPSAEPAAAQADPATPQTKAGKSTPQPEGTPPADPRAEKPKEEKPREEKPKEEPAKEPKPAETPPTPTVDRSTPRATMQSFLVAIEDATGDKPERINDAVKCLDLSRMEEEGADRTEAAQKLAGRLGRLIDQKGVLLQDIPEQPDTDVYTFLAKDVTVGGQERRLFIELRRQPDTDLWLFTPRTLDDIPELERAPVAPTEAAAAPAAAPAPAASAPGDREIPVSRRTPRATMKTFLEAMNNEPPNYEEALACLNSAQQDAKSWELVGTNMADKLVYVMDRIKYVVYQEIPDTPDGQPYTWYTSAAGNIVIARVEEGEAKGEWRFTPQTLNNIEALYRANEDKPLVLQLREAGKTDRVPWRLWLRSKVPDWLKDGTMLGVSEWQWIGIALLFLLGWGVRKAVAFLATMLISPWLHRWKIRIEWARRRAAVGPVGTIALGGFWYAGLQFLDLPPAWLALLVPLTKLIIAIGVVWVVFSMVDLLGEYIAGQQEVRLTKFDDLLIPFMRKFLKILVSAFAIVFIAQVFEKDITGLVATLGIGGLAVALAARDTLENFFGSITVLFDRPFQTGDWIVLGDVEGTVERVGFRSTRVRTFYNSLITIPNSRIVNSHVDNLGLRRYRRAKTVLSITYNTPPEKIDAFCEGIRELIRLHPYTRKDYYHVYFNQFDAASLGILLYVFFEAPDWATELRERHRLFVDILRLAQKIGVEFAFPTQTLYLHRGEEPGFSPLPQEASSEVTGQEAAMGLFDEHYAGSKGVRPPVVIEKSSVARQRRREQND